MVKAIIAAIVTLIVGYLGMVVGLELLGGWTEFGVLVAVCIMGSFIINDSMAKAITVLESGVLDLDPIITHKLPLEELDRGLELMRTGEGMEIIIEIAK